MSEQDYITTLLTAARRERAARWDAEQRAQQYRLVFWVTFGAWATAIAVMILV